MKLGDMGLMTTIVSSLSVYVYTRTTHQGGQMMRAMGVLALLLAGATSNADPGDCARMLTAAQHENRALRTMLLALTGHRSLPPMAPSRPVARVRRLADAPVQAPSLPPLAPEAGNLVPSGTAITSVDDLRVRLGAQVYERSGSSRCGVGKMALPDQTCGCPEDEEPLDGVCRKCADDK